MARCARRSAVFPAAAATVAAVAAAAEHPSSTRPCGFDMPTLQLHVITCHKFLHYTHQECINGGRGYECVYNFDLFGNTQHLQRVLKIEY